jgi:hypothetical protein
MERLKVDCIPQQRWVVIGIMVDRSKIYSEANQVSVRDEALV